MKFLTHCTLFTLVITSMPLWGMQKLSIRDPHYRPQGCIGGSFCTKLQSVDGKTTIIVQYLNKEAYALQDISQLHVVLHDIENDLYYQYNDDTGLLRPVQYDAAQHADVIPVTLDIFN